MMTFVPAPCRGSAPSSCACALQSSRHVRWNSPWLHFRFVKNFSRRLNSNFPSMTAGVLVLLLLLPSALGWTPFGQDVSGSDTWVKVNSSASDFEWFRERFGRSYEVNSPQFDRRLFFFQVGSGSCSANASLPPVIQRYLTSGRRALSQTMRIPQSLMWDEWMRPLTINPLV